MPTDTAHLIQHHPCQVFQELLVGAELFRADGDEGALEELVAVDEKSDLRRKAIINRTVRLINHECHLLTTLAHLSSPLLGGDVDERVPVGGRRSRAAERGGHGDGVLEL